MSKILIVEDDRRVVTFLTTILLGAGYTCVTAPDAQIARDLLETEQGIRLVLLDQNLGQGSETGLALLTELRQSPKFSHVPVIICSGDTRGVVVAGFIRQRVAGFLKKPFRPDRLLADVERILGQSGNAIAASPPASP